jgi:hypothetical protein
MNTRAIAAKRGARCRVIEGGGAAPVVSLARFLG